ncbi:MAG: hypothetical protein KDA88_21565, partial [Planctomycetaceae bacterium]|nr:hypothetical protein [Planctomycetaceae bacterium]
EDGTVVWWDVKDGWPLTTKPNAHSGGVLDCSFGPKGELVTCGRDGIVKVWSANGSEVKKFSLSESTVATVPTPTGVRVLPTRVSFSNDGSTVLAGDTAGNVHSWEFP